MSVAETELAQWPERFVYVCTAGGAATVNLSPMIHAGSSRIVGLVVLRAIADHKSPTTSERAQAIIPASRLMNFARNVLDLSQNDIVLITRHPDLLSDWTNVLATAAELARAKNAEVVFNITGGRKPASLGALLGYSPASDGPRMSLISVGLSPFVVRLVQWTDTRTLSESPLPVLGRLGLSDYIASYGLVETAKTKRIDLQHWMLAQANATLQVRGLFDGGGVDTLRCVQSCLSWAIQQKIS